MSLAFRNVGAVTAYFLLVGGTASATAWASRPAEDLRCIYDGASETILDQVGEAFWSGRDDEIRPGQLLAPAARDCVDRHGWSADSLIQASRYALGAAAVRHFRARMAAMGAPITNWDEVYDSLPVDERIRQNHGHIVRDRAIAAITDAQYARDPEALGHSGAFFSMRRMIERAERSWAGLSLPD